MTLGLIPLYFSSTIAIGFITAVLIIVSGIRQKHPEYRALAVLSILFIGYQYTTFAYHSSQSIEQAVFWLKIQVCFASMIFPLYFYTFSLWARHPKTLYWSLLLVVIASVLIIINIFSEYSLRFSSIEDLKTIQLFGNESISILRGEISSIMVVAHGLTLLVLCGLLYITKQLFNTNRAIALLLGMTVCIQLLVAIVSLMTDMGSVFLMYLPGLPFLFLSLGVCVFGAYTFRSQVEQVSQLAIQAEGLKQSMSELAKGANISETDDFYFQMLKSLYELTGAAYIFIGICELNEQNQKIIVTKAFVKHGTQDENFSYSLADTPCEQVFEHQACLYHQGVADLFPKDKMLTDMQVEGYFGTPLLGEGGDLVGLLTVLDTKPFTPGQELLDAIKIFAARAASEIRRDATELKLRRMAYVDYTTGLANKVRLFEVITEVFADCNDKQQNAVLIIVDIKRFSHINRDFGYEAGEQVLKEISHRFRQYDSSDIFFARNGADEFGLLIKNSAADPAALLELHREDITALLRRPMSIGNQRIRIDLSIGAVIFPRQTGDRYDVIRCAESALAQAKQLGHGSYCLFEPKLFEASERNQVLDAQLRLALNSDQQLSLVYQPKTNRQGELSGVEALLRWHHPILGHISPAEFIPIAERSELIIEVGEWVCNTAFAQLSKWKKQNFHCKVAVNVSASQLLTYNFVDTLLSQLISYELTPECIEIEITESGLLDDIDYSVMTLKRLRESGISIAIDDFGTGYSSLSYLRRLPVDVLKIDKSFIDDIDQKSAAELIKTIITIGKQLSIDIVAEGTETVEQVDKLEQMGCSRFQGYFFSKPLPPEQIPNWTFTP